MEFTVSKTDLVRELNLFSGGGGEEDHYSYPVECYW